LSLGIRRGFSRYEAQQMSRTIQSNDYVPGVSGWKFGQATGTFEINGLPAERSNVIIEGGRLVISKNGTPQCVLGHLPDLRDGQEAKPFIVVDGVTYIRQSFIDDCTVTRAIIAQECSARMTADSVMSARVSALEAQISQLRSR
jgi:hypothetical protein